MSEGLIQAYSRWCQRMTEKQDVSYLYTHQRTVKALRSTSESESAPTDRAGSGEPGSIVDESRLRDYLVSIDYQHDVVLREIPDIARATGVGYATEVRWTARLLASVSVTGWAWDVAHTWRRQYWQQYLWEGDSWSSEQAERIWTEEVARARPLLAPEEVDQQPQQVRRFGTLWRQETFPGVILSWDMEGTPPAEPDPDPEPAAAPGFDRVGWLSAALSTGLAAGQARLAMTLAQQCSGLGMIQESRRTLGLWSALSCGKSALEVLIERGLVRVVRPGDWLDLRATRYRLVLPETHVQPPQTFKESIFRGLGVRFDHDAWRDGSPLSPTVPVVAWMAVTEGPWRNADLARVLGVTAKTIRDWRDVLLERGMVESGHGTITRLVPRSEWPLDQVAEEAGTKGAADRQRAAILAERKRSEPARLEALAKRRERQQQERQSAEMMKDLTD